MIEREHTSHPEVITAERRRMLRRARPARAHVERRVGRGEGSGDPSGAHGARRDPGGGAARLRSGAETAADTVVEERERGNGAGPTRPERWSGEARAARRGDPRRRRCALAERNVDGPARGPAREGQNELEERVLQGVSASGQKHTGWGRGVNKIH